MSKLGAEKVPLLVKAFGTPRKSIDDIDVRSERFFCPGTLQREFFSCSDGQRLKNHPVTHIATQYVSTCIVTVLHSAGSQPHTAIAHIDTKTDIAASLDQILQSFSDTPSATILSHDFAPGHFEVLRTWPGGEPKARFAIAALKKDRMARLEEISVALLNRQIPIASIDLDCPHPSFIVRVKDGAVFNGTQYDPYISHNRHVDEYLSWFHGTKQAEKLGVVWNPYKSMDLK